MQHAYVQLKLKNKNSNLIKFKYYQSSNSNSELNSSANRQLSGSGCGNLIPTWIFCEFDLCTSNATTRIAYCWSNSCVPNFIAAGIQPTLIVAAACCKHNCIQSWKYGRHWLMLQQVSNSYKAAEILIIVAAASCRAAEMQLRNWLLLHRQLQTHCRAAEMQPNVWLFLRVTGSATVLTNWLKCIIMNEMNV